MPERHPLCALRPANCASAKESPELQILHLRLKHRMTALCVNTMHLRWHGRCRTAQIAPPTMRRLPAPYRHRGVCPGRAARLAQGRRGELALSSPALSRRVQALERFVGQAAVRATPSVASKLNPMANGLLAADRPRAGRRCPMRSNRDCLTAQNEVLRLRLGVLPLFASQRLHPAPARAQGAPSRAAPRRRHRRARACRDWATGSTRRSCWRAEIDPALYARRLDRNFVSGARIATIVDGGPTIGHRSGAVRQRSPVLLHRDMPETFADVAPSGRAARSGACGDRSFRFGVADARSGRRRAWESRSCSKATFEAPTTTGSSRCSKHRGGEQLQLLLRLSPSAR